MGEQKQYSLDGCLARIGCILQQHLQEKKKINNGELDVVKNEAAGECLNTLAVMNNRM